MKARVYILLSIAACLFIWCEYSHCREPGCPRSLADPGFCGLLLLSTVIVHYSVAWSLRKRGYWPPLGHPWSGITLILMSIYFLIRGYNREANPILMNSLMGAWFITATIWACLSMKNLYRLLRSKK